MSLQSLTVVRKFNTQRDAVAHDAKCIDHRSWVVAVHAWPTGHQELVFASTDEARAWAEANSATFADARAKRTGG